MPVRPSLWTAICLAVLATLLSGQASQGASFGRHWFETVPGREIAGFVSGYYDCLSNPIERALPGWDASNELMLKEIARYYAEHPHSQAMVAGVLHWIAAHTHPYVLPGGEVFSGRHGFMDGLWWVGTRPEGQKGYVEGYLYCLGHHDMERVAPEIAAGISAWYKTHPKREARPIAITLQQVLRQLGIPLIPAPPGRNARAAAH